MKRDYKFSLEQAMVFIEKAYIQDKSHPDYHGLWHLYDSRSRSWNIPYMELGMQVIFDALLPYYEFSRNSKWLNTSKNLVKGWGMSALQNMDKNSPAYGGLKHCNVVSHTCYGRVVPIKYHTFDNACALLAFLMVYKNTSDKKILERACPLSDFLRRSTQKDGWLKVYFDAYDNTWSKDSFSVACAGVGYAAWAYSYWYHISREEKYKNWALAYCNTALEFQKKSGFISPNKVEVAEFMIYVTEGLYWTGKYCHNKEFIQRAKFTFDAMMNSDKSGPGNMYFKYNSDWTPDKSRVDAKEGALEKDMLSTCGQYAKLAYYFYELTKEDKYKKEYIDTIDFMYDIQDRSSEDTNMRGGWPRATNSEPGVHFVCPAYNYVGALLSELKTRKLR